MFNIDKIRKDFPILKIKSNNKPLIFFDNGASSQKPQIVLNKISMSENKDAINKVKSMIVLAGLVRKGFVQGDLTNVLSPRTIINWAENYKIFNNFIRFFKFL